MPNRGESLIADTRRIAVEGDDRTVSEESIAALMDVSTHITGNNLIGRSLQSPRITNKESLDERRAEPH